NGLKYIAKKVHASAVTLADNLKKSGIKQLNTAYFDTILVEADSEKVKSVAEAHEVNFLYVDANKIAISLNEATTLSDINTIIKIFSEALGTANENATTLTENTSVLNGLQRK